MMPKMPFTSTPSRATTALPSSKAEPVAVSQTTAPAYGKFWMIYFLLMIGLIGGTLAYGIGGPLCLLGRIFPAARRLGSRVIQKGIWLLMWLEPWFHADIRLAIPPGSL